MGAWKRWQDWTAVLLGVILFATPFIFETTADTASSWTAYVIGALLVTAGVWSASTDEPDALIEGAPLILGLALMAAPWFLSYTSVVTMAWMSWIVGIAAALNAGAEMLFVAARAPAST